MIRCYWWRVVGMSKYGGASSCNFQKLNKIEKEGNRGRFGNGRIKMDWCGHLMLATLCTQPSALQPLHHISISSLKKHHVSNLAWLRESSAPKFISNYNASRTDKFGSSKLCSSCVDETWSTVLTYCICARTEDGLIEMMIRTWWWQKIFMWLMLK